MTVAAASVALVAVDLSRVRVIGVETADDAHQNVVTPCEADKFMLEVAIEAWYATYGDNRDPTQDDLVRDGMLRDEIDAYDLRPGGVAAVDIEPAVGGGCD